MQALLGVVELTAGGLTPAASAAVKDPLAFSHPEHGHSYESNDDHLVLAGLGDVLAALVRRGARASDSEEEEQPITGGNR